MIEIVHAAHYATTMLVFGAVCFLHFIARPALGASVGMPEYDAQRIVTFALRLAWWGLTGSLVTGLLWLFGQAVTVSGLPPQQALRPSILLTILEQTAFGRIWEIRFGLAVLLGVLLHVARSADRIHRFPSLDWAWGILAAALLATLAFAGHAMSRSGIEGMVHLSADLVHLLASGAWLGALPPLVHLLTPPAAIVRSGSLTVAQVATRRFSILGIVSVSALVLTGLVNSWFLVGNVPALLGTAYGRLLLVKLALFALMLSLAAVNRSKLTPHLHATASGFNGVPAPWKCLRRNAAMETALGLALLLVLGMISTSTPGLHDQAVWPFPFDLSWEAASQNGLVRWATWTACVGAMIGIALVAYGMRQRRRLAAPLGLAMLGLAVIAPVWLLAVPAYPTTYFHSPARYGAVSIARGEPLYAEHCGGCHGLYGYGDGPVAAQLGIKPANLTGEHLFHHSEGTLFWWLSNGIEGTPMPGFASSLSEAQRWDLLNFLHVQADAEQASVMGPEIEAWHPVVAPDFAFQIGDQAQETLKAQRGRSLVLIVLYSAPGSFQRLRQLAEAQPLLERAGLRAIAIPIDSAPSVPDGAETASARAGIGAAAGPETIATYRQFRRTSSVEGVPPMPEHLEFLVDRQGYLRFRWNPADGAGWQELANLLRRVEALNQEPPRPPAPEGHIH
ncbi:MAG: CopD family protein [Proteobacteria bacterium]|nr:CopD family protein [Pseudomonadota bacterium]